MQQQINLYSFLPKPPKDFLNITKIIVISIIFIFVLSLISAYQIWQKSALNEQYNMFKRLEAIAIKNLSDTKQRYPEIVDTAKLPENLPKLQEAINDMNKNLLPLLQGENVSEYFIAFAESTTQGLWLREITLENGGLSIELVGSAMQADLVQKFIERCNSQPTFAKQKLTLLEVLRPTLDKDVLNMKHIDFTLVSTY